MDRASVSMWALWASDVILFLSAFQTWNDSTYFLKLPVILPHFPSCYSVSPFRIQIRMSISLYVSDYPCSQRLDVCKQSQGNCAIHAVHAPPATLSPCRCVFLSKLIQHLRAICATILRQGHGDNLTHGRTLLEWWQIFRMLRRHVKTLWMVLHLPIVSNLLQFESKCDTLSIPENIPENAFWCKLCFTIGSINSG